MNTIMEEENPYFSQLEKSRSMDSLSTLAASKTCVCSPTRHPGSFRCRYHRQPPNPSSGVPSPAVSVVKAEAANHAMVPACSALKHEGADGK
ncbi:hypothetical protein HPP92_006397 [Vanilla planifolia]|uniref:Uncharacterized protein n=1 Tax=Vanilla planifolia TaxID=51239 RepID=A0A835V6R2_VANPL|nr:hypothetical protein HPP92_006397 [Vanilla planifolia]